MGLEFFFTKLKWVKMTFFLLPDGGAISECHFGDVDTIITIKTNTAKEQLKKKKRKKKAIFLVVLYQRLSGHVDIIFAIITNNYNKFDMNTMYCLVGV